MNSTPSLQLIHPNAPNGFARLEVAHPTCRGQLSHLGGQVLSWAPAGSLPVIYLSPRAVFSLGSGIRGGIPICWPWFGPKEGAPSHGTVRGAIWKWANTEEDDEGVSVTYCLAQPGIFLETTVHLGAKLYVSLTTTNRGTADFSLTAALHSYLAVGKIEATTILGLEDTIYEDVLDQHQRKFQQGPVTFHGEVDRDYQTSHPVEIVDEEWQRTILVEHSGSTGVVVWNPWKDKTLRLGDLPPDSFHRFLCVEAVHTGSPLVLAPGESHTLSTTISVRPSAPHPLAGAPRFDKPAAFFNEPDLVESQGPVGSFSHPQNKSTFHPITS